MEFNELIDAIKDYSNVVLDKAGELGKMAASKTDTAVKKAKTKYGIAELEGKKRKLFEAMGEKLYTDYKAGNETEIFNDEFVKLDELDAEIKELKNKLSEYKDSVVCAYCGKNNDIDNEFCPACGAKLKTDEPDEAESEDVIEVVENEIND